VSLHLALAWIAAALDAVVAVLLIAGALRHAQPRFAIDRAILAVEAAVGLALLSGALALVAGPGPHDGLHLVYAVIALVALPIGRAWRGLATGPRPIPLGIGVVVLFGVLVRLAQTG
jgi:hypothetical protein